MSDPTKPDYSMPVFCNQCYQEPTRMGAVLVQVGDEAPTLRLASEVFELGRGGKIT